MDNNNEPQLNTGETVPPVTPPLPPREPQQSDLQPGMQREAAAPPPQEPVAESAATTPPPTEGGGKKSMGAIFGVIVIIVLLVFAGFYFWGSQLNKALVVEETTVDEMTPEEIAAQPNPTLDNLQSQSTSDELTDIEADLGATELNGLDQELSDIDQELTF